MGMKSLYLHHSHYVYDGFCFVLGRFSPCYLSVDIGKHLNGNVCVAVSEYYRTTRFRLDLFRYVFTSPGQVPYKFMFVAI